MHSTGSNLLQKFQWLGEDTHSPEKNISPSEGPCSPWGGPTMVQPVIIFVDVWEHPSGQPTAELDCQREAQIISIFSLPLIVISCLSVVRGENLNSLL